MKSRFTLVVAAHLLLIKGKHILLQRRYNTGYEDGKYSLPAGHSEGAETITQALAREISEEIGIKTIDPTCVHVMHRLTNREQIDFFFKVEKWVGKPRILETQKADHLEWFTLTDLPENTTPYVKKAIEYFKKNIYYSEFGWDT